MTSAEMVKALAYDIFGIDQLDWRIEIIERFEDENQEPTPEERKAFAEFLRHQFTIRPSGSASRREIARLLKNLTGEEIDAIALAPSIPSCPPETEEDREREAKWEKEKFKFRGIAL